MRLPIDFYQRHVVDVAKDLLGKQLNFGHYHGIITETEAYRGKDDEASHAYRGRTKRSTIMFGPPGFSYVYLIYGIYYCLNIVSEAEDQAAAVLIRGLKLPDRHLDGPGKICKALQITKTQNGINLVEDKHFYLSEGIKPGKLIISNRIGIKKAMEKPWRFLLDFEELDTK